MSSESWFNPLLNRAHSFFACPLPQNPVGDLLERRVKTEYSLLDLIHSPDIPFRRPDGILIHPVTRNLFISDSGQGDLHMFDQENAYVSTTAIKPGVKYRYSNPSNRTGLTVSLTGELLALDELEGTIFVIETSSMFGRIVKKFGTKIGFPHTTGALVSPSAIAVDFLGNILVTDSGSHKVQVFDSSGVWQKFIGTACGDQIGELASPSGIAVDVYNTGEIFVSERGNKRIQIFSPGGVPRAIIGGGDKDLLAGPMGLTIDADQKIIVADFGFDQSVQFVRNIKIFSREGQLLMKFIPFGI